jgi:hypothetical protein
MFTTSTTYQFGRKIIFMDSKKQRFYNVQVRKHLLAASATRHSRSRFQWVWNLRLELGHQLHPDPVRTTEFAPTLPSAHDQTPDSSSPPQGYGPGQVALPWKAGRFSGQDFPLQPDGTLRCPAGQELRAHEQRREADGSLRVVYAASIRRCRPCHLRKQCQWNGSATAKPR